MMQVYTETETQCMYGQTEILHMKYYSVRDDSRIVYVNCSQTGDEFHESIWNIDETGAILYFTGIH